MLRPGIVVRRDATRVYDHTATAMHDNEYTAPRASRLATTWYCFSGILVMNGLRVLLSDDHIYLCCVVMNVRACVSVASRPNGFFLARGHCVPPDLYSGWNGIWGVERSARTGEYWRRLWGRVRTGKG